jgi:hypothetical protein
VSVALIISISTFGMLFHAFPIHHETYKTHMFDVVSSDFPWSGSRAKGRLRSAAKRFATSPRHAPRVSES